MSKTPANSVFKQQIEEESEECKEKEKQERLMPGKTRRRDLLYDQQRRHMINIKGCREVQ